MIGGTFFYIILCVAVGIYASTTGRSGFLWGGISLFVSPFLVSIVLMIMHNIDNKQTGEIK